MDTRNRYVLTIDVELTSPLGESAARSAADLLARDVAEWLRSIMWGFGVARVQAAYAPTRQFEGGDFIPVGERT